MIRKAHRFPLDVWVLAVLAIAGTLFLVPWGCYEALVQEGSNAPAKWCDGVLGFRTPLFSSAEPGVTLASIALTVILLIEATRRSFRIRSRHDGR